MLNRQTNHHTGPPAFAVRIDFETAAQLPDSFTHATKSDTGSSGVGHFILLCP